MLISITGPSGVGKGYVTERVIERYPFIRELIWITTRPLRAGESFNASRKTISVSKFREYQDKERFIIDQKLFGHFYGLEERVFHEAIEGSDVCWTEFHIDSLIQIAKLGFRVVSIALILSDIALLERRLNNRGKSRDGEVRERIIAVRAEVDKINCHSELFLKTIEVSDETEDKVVSQVIEALKSFLCR